MAPGAGMAPSCFCLPLCSFSHAQQRGLNRVVSSLAPWLSDSALNVDENQLSFAFPLAPGVADSVVRCAKESSSHPWQAARSPQGFLSLAPLPSRQTRRPISANCGTFSQVDRCPVGSEHSPRPCRLSLRLNITASGQEKRWFCCDQQVSEMTGSRLPRVRDFILGFSVFVCSATN